ncbi:MAG: hypothetical protein CMJ94_14625 [Planctomycetes bacterium]|nr:hypothetical protein [Planctomycetota bacterium]
MPALRLLVPLLLMTSCGGPPAPTPESEWLAELITLVDAQVRQVEAPYQLDILTEDAMGLDEEGIGPIHQHVGRPLLISDPLCGLVLSLAMEQVWQPKLEQAWRVEAMPGEEGWVRLIRHDGHALEIQLAQQERAWVMLDSRLDPEQHPLVRDASAEEFVLSYAEYLLALYGITRCDLLPGDDREYFFPFSGLAESHSWKRVGFEAPQEASFREWIDSMGVLLAPATRWTVEAHRGLAQGWAQSVELSSIQLEDDESVTAVVRLVQKVPEQDRPRTCSMRLVVEQRDGAWYLSELPRSVSEEVVHTLQFHADDQRWHLTPPNRF